MRGGPVVVESADETWWMFYTDRRATTGAVRRDVGSGTPSASQNHDGGARWKFVGMARVDCRENGHEKTEWRGT